MTPVKDPRVPLSFQSADGSGGEDTSMMDDTSSVLSSPPRSGRRTCTLKDDSFSSSSSGSRLSFGSAIRRSPQKSQNRRLFDEDSANGCDEEGSGQLSPPRRRMLRPLDLNHDLQVQVADGESASSSSTTAPAEANSEAQQGQQQQLQQGRKRTSAERRSGQSTPKLDPSTMMESSPLISPNSYLTVDGRFVQSKNPFSSPMVTEEETQFAGAGTGTGGNAAPTMPMSFNNESDNSNNNMPGFLPPRHDRAPFGYSSEAMKAASIAAAAPLASGYPDRRFSFTGSPIQEDDNMMETTNSSIASGGSLHKVRRINRTDDIVSASGLHLSARRRDLTIETNNHGASMNTANGAMFDDISPTEVMSFPPPTPVKQKKPTRQPYASIRCNDPTTPIAERRRMKLGARTPHPGSYAHNQHHDEDSCDGDGRKNPKSRFYSDFDVIGNLGSGSFGDVFRVLSRLDGCMYAIKAARRKAKGASDRDRMLKEVYALAALSDQADPATFHIVRYHQAWMEDDRLYIQTELCSGTLADDVAQGIMTEPRRFKLLREMLLALDFLHRQHMVHLDIKPENILIKNDQYKLSDFGLVSRRTPTTDVEEGDSRYMSMELLSGDLTDLTKSDIFSLGASVYEIALGRSLPMNGQEWQDIRAGRTLPLPNTSPDLVVIIRQMMVPVASMRPSASQLLTHPQLLSDDQKALRFEKNRVMQANMKLQAQMQNQLSATAPPPKRALSRASTWSGRLPNYL